MRKKWIEHAPLLWMLAIPILNVFYGILNHGKGKVSNLTTPWDDMIPFLPIFVIPYLIWYPFVFGMLIVFFFKDRIVFYRSLTIICIGLVISYLVFYLYQTTIIRPMPTQDGILYWLVNVVYSTDAPYNCFPSIHVLTSHVVLKAAFQCQWSKFVKSAVGLTSWAIIVSTLFVKQHVLFDIAGGIILSEVLFLVVRRSFFKLRRKERVVHEL